ncbi:hypothetical protein H8356DRAFT_926486 [Neocallimastix lanati (nom. inval.)]|nr:hypothetical protein H8356DRAFT_926486 [Neocallimastix sp. JGI-2020a]
MEKMQANSIMDDKKRDNNRDEDEKLISSNNKISPTILDEKNLSYDFYADTANKQGKDLTSSPNYQQIDNIGKSSYTSETSDVSNSLTNNNRNDSNLSQKLREENNKVNEERNEIENDNPTLKQFISNVKSINSNNKIPISISIENKSTSSLFKTNPVITRKEQHSISPQKCSSPITTPTSPGFQVVLLLEKSNSISFIVDFQEIDNNINNENKGINEIIKHT